MSKFKVGDRVRVKVEHEGRYSRPFVSAGFSGVVGELLDRDCVAVNLTDGPLIDIGDGFEFGGAGWAYQSDELELIHD